jgi:hypothetical protein
MRYLFASANSAFADEFLHQPRRDGLCLCLGADVAIGPDDTWDTVVARLP